MTVFELRVPVPREAIPALDELLEALEDQRLMVIEDIPSHGSWLVGYFESTGAAAQSWKYLSEANNAAWSKCRPEVRALPDTDWKDSYKVHFKASKFGRLNWVPDWERDRFVLAPGEEVLWLDPGMAFGTGNHETTRLCCVRLADCADQRGTAGRVIDAGCGSGILALSALKLGFQEVVGFDIDPEAIRVSKVNARSNELASRLEFYVGDISAGLKDRQAELVLANIQADVLMKFAEDLCAAVVPGGELVLSGILRSEIGEVRRRFCNAGRSWKVDSAVLGDWADLCLIG